MRSSSSEKKPLFWVGSSKRELLDMPQAVRREFGYALSVAQHGGHHAAAKPWKGEGPGLFEIVTDHDRGTYRAVYTAQFRSAIYVLHCFQKKSPRGIRTARRDVERVRARLAAARSDHEARHGKD